MNLTAEQLRQELFYDPETGLFSRIQTGRGRQAHPGNVAGCVYTSGYVLIRINYQRYGAHRLAWLYVHGDWPKGQIDHIDGDPSNNRIANLRDVTQSQNMHNLHGPPINNTSGVRGVCWHTASQKWRATIYGNRRQVNLGAFKSFDDAIAARRAGEQTYHPTVPR